MTDPISETVHAVKDALTVVLTDRCKKCGLAFRRLLLMAMAQDAGAHVTGAGVGCEHEF